MHAALAALLELEMLHRVREIAATAVDPGLCHGTIQQLAGWTHEWTSLEVFLITRLFADECDCGTDGTFSEHGFIRSPQMLWGCRDISVELGQVLWCPPRCPDNRSSSA